MLSDFRKSIKHKRLTKKFWLNFLIPVDFVEQIRLPFPSTPSVLVLVLVRVTIQAYVLCLAHRVPHLAKKG